MRKLAPKWTATRWYKKVTENVLWGPLFGPKSDAIRARAPPQIAKSAQKSSFWRVPFFDHFSMHFSMNFGPPRRPRGAPKNRCFSHFVAFFPTFLRAFDFWSIFVDFWSIFGRFLVVF